MKIILFFLPLVICFDNYYIDNFYTDKILECGNKSNEAINIKWYEAKKGVFTNMSISNKKISVQYCPAIFYCQYVDYIDNNFNFSSADLFVVNCLQIKEDLARFYETTQKIIDKISNNNFYISIFLLIILIFYYLIKKFNLNKLILNKQPL
jgi:hypothetical protein